MKLLVRLSLLVFSLASARQIVEAQSGPHVLLMYDMEGISGIDSLDYTLFNSPLYRLGQRLLAEDVNAVVDGLMQGGAGRVTVVDIHKSGNPEPDLPPSALDSRAQMYRKRSAFHPYFDLNEEFDALVCVGAHPGGGSEGFLAHTYTFGPVWQINGVLYNDLMLLAHSSGKPVIMASGEDILGDEMAQLMPNLEYAVVKETANRSSAILITSGQARDALRGAARRAARKLRQGVSQSWGPSGPFRWQMTLQNERQTELASRLAGVSRVDSLNVEYRSDDFRSGLGQTIYSLLPNVAVEQLEFLRQFLASDPRFRPALRAFEERLQERWLRAETGPKPLKSDNRHYGLH